MPAYPKGGADLICDALLPLPAGSAASAVTQSLLDLFASGAVMLGTRLPPERRLAEVLQVGRSAVRESLATLGTLGLVESRPGAGTFLRATHTSLPAEGMRWNMLIGENELDELIELRAALEIHAAWLAAERGDTDTIARLGQHLERMRATVDDVPTFLEADRAFHRELAVSSSNRRLQELLDITHELLRAQATSPEARHHACLAVGEHERVYEAVAAGDPATAADAMRSHMRHSASLLRTSVAA